MRPNDPGSENPADVVWTARSEKEVEFSDLSERRALKVAAMTRYVSAAHFRTWDQLRRRPNFDTLEGVFTPLVLIDIEATDVAIEPRETLYARGETMFGKVLDGDGNVRNVTRDGSYVVSRADGDKVGVVRFVNVFTRYDTDPMKRKVLEIPEELGVGRMPSRVTDLPTVQTMLPLERAPDFPEKERNVWYYTQTDPNRHVNSLAYLHVAQEYVATRLHHAGHRMDRLWARRARICFRKPCFRGEEYQRRAWINSESPLVVCAAIAKSSDPEGHLPATAVELTLAEHAD